MKIEELQMLAANRLANLRLNHAESVRIGDVEQMARIESDITETQATIDILAQIAE